MHILITGGAGFIGSHLADDLLAAGHRVRALGNLSSQGHGTIDRPPHLNQDVEFVYGDVRDADAIAGALDGIDAVFHLAAAVVGQSLLTIFAARLLDRHAPPIFEDGLQRRDSISVYDVVQACRLALEVPAAAGQAINIGSGRSVTVREVSDLVARILNLPIEPKVCGKYRVGDIRHCFADITSAVQCSVINRPSQPRTVSSSWPNSSRIRARRTTSPKPASDSQ